MPARATRSAPRPRARGVRRLAAALAGGIALTASACVGDWFRAGPRRARYVLESPPPSADLVGKLA